MSEVEGCMKIITILLILALALCVFIIITTGATL